MENSDYLSVIEAAQRLNMSRSGVRGLLKMGYLTFIKIANKIRIPLRDVETQIIVRSKSKARPRVTRRERYQRKMVKAVESTPQPVTCSIAVPAEASGEWMPLIHAARSLNLSPSYFKRLAVAKNFPFKRERNPEGAICEGKLRGRIPYWYPVETIMLELERREELASRGAVELQDKYGKIRRMPYIRSTIEAPPGDVLISTIEAAFILKVCLDRIGKHVRSGRLFAWQKQPGKRGSKVWLSANQVVRYANDPERLRSRKARLEGAQKPTPEVADRRPYWLEDNNFGFADVNGKGRNFYRNYGGFYNSSQVADILGISKSALVSLRVRGQITLYQRQLKKGQDPYKKWYFYLKEDVHNLANLRAEQRRKRFGNGPKT